MRPKRLILLLMAGFLAGTQASAQFMLFGEDPARIRWRQAESKGYRLIYPEGADSLARTYLGLLEQYRPVVGASLGMMPGQYQPLCQRLRGLGAAPDGSVHGTGAV